MVRRLCGLLQSIDSDEDPVKKEEGMVKKFIYFVSRKHLPTSTKCPYIKIGTDGSEEEMILIDSGAELNIIGFKQLLAWTKRCSYAIIQMLPPPSMASSMMIR